MTKTPGRFPSCIAFVALALTAVLPAHAVSAQCVADLNGDRKVSGADIGILLGEWGTAGGNTGADIDGNGTVSGSDLGAMLGAWGDCPVTVPSWATLVEAQPDPAVVTDAALRAAIKGTGLAWRVRDTVTQVEMLLVPPGTFQMGCVMGSTAIDCYTVELPVHQVTLTRPYYLGRFELTQAQWKARMAYNPSYMQYESAQVPQSEVPRRPVEGVTWVQVEGFLGVTGVRLPTEAEWEFACRAGTVTPFHNGSTNDGTVGALGWYEGNAMGQTRPVGGKAANALGFHDMLGNVQEWVSDRYGYYTSSPKTDPTGPATGPLMGVVRGGSWTAGTGGVRASYRQLQSYGSPSSTVGLRIARSP